VSVLCHVDRIMMSVLFSQAASKAVLLIAIATTSATRSATTPATERVICRARALSPNLSLDETMPTRYKARQLRALQLH
jgi:hypothetical protein